MDDLFQLISNLHADEMTAEIDKLADAIQQMSVAGPQTQISATSATSPTRNLNTSKANTYPFYNSNAKSFKVWKAKQQANIDTAMDLDQIAAGEFEDVPVERFSSRWTSAPGGVDPTPMAMDVISYETAVVHDAFRGELGVTVFLHIKTRVLHQKIPLFDVAKQLRRDHDIDIEWLALIQVGMDLITAAAEHYDIELESDNASRSPRELAGRIRVHRIKCLVWAVIKWRYESTENFEKTECERFEYETRYGRDSWQGYSIHEEVVFGPFVEE